uniref:Candidate secreted effector n=1 Tax=Meloidogyne incognita TaxID=6306 RepID=A0A914NAB8_MELIC
MLKNSFNTSQSLYHISSIIVQVPKFSIMSLMCPPERILFQNLISLKFCSNSPSFVISKCISIFLEECIDSRNSSIPTIIQIFQSKTAILSICFLSFQCIFCPNTL